jgi:hypothetical protein
MIYELLKRDDVWRILPYYAAGCALLLPPMSASSSRLIFLAAMVGAGTVTFAVQCATTFQTGLPIAARQLFLARLLALPSLLWAPVLAAGGVILVISGVARADSVFVLAKSASFFTLMAAALHSIKPQELSLPVWTTMMVLCVLPPWPC